MFFAPHSLLTVLDSVSFRVFILPSHPNLFNEEIHHTFQGCRWGGFHTNHSKGKFLLAPLIFRFSPLYYSSTSPFKQWALAAEDPHAVSLWTWSTSLSECQYTEPLSSCNKARLLVKKSSWAWTTRAVGSISESLMNESKANTVFMHFDLVPC